MVPCAAGGERQAGAGQRAASSDDGSGVDGRIRADATAANGDGVPWLLVLGGVVVDGDAYGGDGSVADACGAAGAGVDAVGGADGGTDGVVADDAVAVDCDEGDAVVGVADVAIADA